MNHSEVGAKLETSVFESFYGDYFIFLTSRRYIAGGRVGGWGGGGQLPPSGKLNAFFSNIVFEFAGLYFFCIGQASVKVCEVCPRRQKIVGTVLDLVVDNLNILVFHFFADEAHSFFFNSFPYTKNMP